MDLRMDSPSGSPQVVVLEGEWDLARRTELHEMLHASSSAPQLIVDLSRAYFMDSTALSEIVRLNKSREAAALPPPLFVVNALIQRVFDVVNFTSLYQIYQTMEDAVAEAR